jgi:hypothetical protein
VILRCFTTEDTEGTETEGKGSRIRILRYPQRIQREEVRNRGKPKKERDPEP